MKMFKKILTAAAVTAVMAVSAQAAMINVGGVVFDPDSPADFSGTTATITQSINPSTGELSGFGNVTIINNTIQSMFCPGCELTISYSGYTPILGSATLVPGVGGGGTTIQYSGGSIKLYVDSTPDTNNGTTLTAANTSDGVLWLELVGHPDANGITLTGTNLFPTLLQGGGLLDVIAGLAKNNLDTNTQPLGSDLSFSTTFTRFPGGSPLQATGSGTFDGNSIPEPASLALLGLGLAGLAAARRRKAAK